MSLITMAETWGSRPEERTQHFPCDDLGVQGRAIFRAIDVAAPVPTTFRWLCQLKVAPYSYDWVDNLGKQSPRSLVAGAEELLVGQRVMLIFKLVSFAYDDHITIQIKASQPRQSFGEVAVTYRVVPTAEGSRIVVKMICPDRGQFLYNFLAFGDLIMMRKQLMTLKHLAEGT